KDLNIKYLERITKNKSTGILIRIKNKIKWNLFRG
ncbi:MAG: hypothetical protein RLZ10_1293, partial [Bacteroidota bacterium]